MICPFAEWRGPLSSVCWEWEGARDRLGYGRVSAKTYGGPMAHKVIYEVLVGPVPNGLELDHLCSNPPCYNPAHLEPVTHAENVRRAARRITHCPQGHKYTDENTKIRRGKRECRVCVQEGRRRYRETHRAELAAKEQARRDARRAVSVC